jgi:hypothetical protein
MINIQRTQTPSICLEKEKKTPSSTNYRCGDVVEKLKIDFLNKCYLCEECAPKGINVEHFIAHRGNRDAMFDWFNLFFSCPHCNNIKSDLYNFILNCTDFDTIITDVIKFNIKPFPNEAVLIEALNKEEKVLKTAELLDKIYNSKATPIKKIESANLRDSVARELNEFWRLILDYSNTDYPPKKEELRFLIGQRLKKESAFTAFKIWEIKSSQFLSKEFAAYI